MLKIVKLLLLPALTLFALPVAAQDVIDHYKTSPKMSFSAQPGEEIEPMAHSANSERFTTRKRSKNGSPAIASGPSGGPAPLKRRATFSPICSHFSYCEPEDRQQ